MARGGSRAVTRLLGLGLALLALLCASAPLAAAVEASTEALKTETQSLYQESQKARAEAEAAQAVAEKSGEEADKAEAEKKAQYAKDVEAKYNEALKAYIDQGGSETEVAVPKVETAQAVTEEDDSELSKLKSECISWYKRTKEAYANADKARLATATEGDKAEAEQKVEYAREVEAKWNVVRKEYVEKGGKAQDCETGYTPGETEDVEKDVDKVKKTIACPKDPLEYCDFYIQGSKDQVPLLSLSRARKEAGSDTPTISGQIKDRHYMQDEESEKTYTVHVRDKKQTKFFCPAPEAEDNGYWPYAGDKFSCTSEGKDYLTPASLQAFYNGEEDDDRTLGGRCAIMQFGTVYVFKDKDAVAKLYPGDNDQEYPEARRCVVFKTGDEEPVCDGSESSPNCPALIPNDDSKDLFPLSKVDRALIERNCSGVQYPANTHACPIQGACAIRGSNSQCEGTKESEESKVGKVATPKECGKAVHVLMPNDYVQKCSEVTFLKSKEREGYQYYCAGQTNNVPECNAMCKDNDWCTNWLLVVPNTPDESPQCGKEGSNYKSQAGCNTDVVTPYYGGCGWCFLMDKDYCGPVCNKFGLDKSKAPPGYTPYWAIHGRTKCSEGKDDPHFLGADGTRFEFNGLPDQSFCLLSDEKVHINMKMHGYLDDRLVGASLLKNGKAVRTWMRELGIMWKSEDSKGTTSTHSLYLKARSGPQRERGDGFLASAKLDGEELLPMEAGSNRTFPSGLTLAFKGVEKYGPYDMDKYSVSIDGVIDLDLKLRVAHPLLQTPKDAEAHFNIMVESLAHTSQIHGVIGQTYRGGRVIRSLEYRALSALLGHPVAADGTEGLGYLDGETRDYVSSDVLSADCKFSSFH